ILVPILSLQLYFSVVIDCWAVFPEQSVEYSQTRHNRSEGIFSCKASLLDRKIYNQDDLRVCGCAACNSSVLDLFEHFEPLQQHCCSQALRSSLHCYPSAYPPNSVTFKADGSQLSPSTIHSGSLRTSYGFPSLENFQSRGPKIG